VIYAYWRRYEIAKKSAQLQDNKTNNTAVFAGEAKSLTFIFKAIKLDSPYHTDNNADSRNNDPQPKYVDKRKFVGF
jgi:hypothetical protein